MVIGRITWRGVLKRQGRGRERKGWRLRPIRLRKPQRRSLKWSSNPFVFLQIVPCLLVLSNIAVAFLLSSGVSLKR